MPKKQEAVIEDRRVIDKKKAIEWSPEYRPPTLGLPHDTLHSKSNFDFASVRKVPFSFQQESFENDVKSPDIRVHDAFEDIPEPSVGFFDDDFSVEQLQRTRSAIPFIRFAPSVFTREEPPLRPPEMFKDGEKVTDINLLKNVFPQSVTFVSISDIKLDSKQRKALCKTIGMLSRLEWLGLRNLGLQNLSEFRALPSLKYCSLSKNNISNLKDCVKMFVRTPFIEVIDLNDNPVATKSSFRDKIIATNANLTLRLLNNLAIGVEERIRAFLDHGTKQIKLEIPAIRWDLRLTSLGEIPQMLRARRWQPDLIRNIEITQANLTIFHVGEFKNLKHLDLSGNKISDVRGTGLEQCDRLRYLNLSNNLIYKKETLKALCFLTSLRRLFLEGNKDLGSYRNLVISLTKDLKGSNRIPGLIELDGKVITIEERIAASAAVNKKENVHGLRYKLLLIQYYGNLQIHTKDFLLKIRHLKLPGCNLQAITVKGLPSLEVLDLSNNFLRVVEGLDFCTRMRYLNLSQNLKLSVKETVAKLAKIKSLEQVLFAVFDTKEHKHHSRNTKYRQKILRELLFNNPNLQYLDNELITTDERVQTFALLGSTAEQVETYRFCLSLNNNCTMPWSRRYHHSEVAIGNQYDPKDITTLRKMSHCKLTSPVCNFERFVNLEELNLSCNRLTFIHKMKLETLPKLRILDVSNNQIDTPIKELASFLDKLEALEILAIHDNPVIRTFLDRILLIGSMMRMREVNCSLRVIDTEISLDERVEAWRKNGGKEAEFEMMRFKALLFLRLPKDIPLFEITSLDLSHGGLQSLDVSKCQKLEVLLLRSNRIKSIENITGLNALKSLRVLDMRKNHLSKLEEIVALILDLPALASIGLKGNKFCENKQWRQKLINSIPQLHEVQMSLRQIDSDEISCGEVVRGWKVSSDSSPDRIRYLVAQLLKIPKGMKPADVTELDLSDCELTLSDIDIPDDYPNLKKLSLKNNAIKSIENSNLEKLTSLEHLDLSGNKIKDMQVLVQLVNKFPALKSFYCDSNPFWEGNVSAEEDLERRVKFLSGVMQMDHLGATLTILNGFPIKISERCRGLLASRVYNEEGIERFRADLIWEKLSPKEDCESLDLSGHEIKSTKHFESRLLHLPNLAHLDLSNNRITNLDELKKALDSCHKLKSLDIRDNQIRSDLRDLIGAIKTYCPLLSILNIERSTAGRETTKPSEYAAHVFPQMANLSTLDGIQPQNQTNGGGKRSVFEVFEERKQTAYPALAPSKDAASSSAAASPSNSQNIVVPDALNAFAPSAPTATITTPLDPSLFQQLRVRRDSVASPPSTRGSVNEESQESFTSLYPDLSHFSPESYLPADYHNTIGRKYDLTYLSQQLALQREQEAKEDGPGSPRERRDDSF